MKGNGLLMQIGKGISICQGMGFGKIFVYREKGFGILPASGDVDLEKNNFRNARGIAARQLEELYKKSYIRIGSDEVKVILAQKMIIDDCDFIASTESYIESGCGAAEAILRSSMELSEKFEQIEDEYIKERAIDLRDVSQRLVDILCNNSKELVIPDDSVVVAYDLTPSELINISSEKIKGIILKYGSKNSHTAILARIMEIPMLIQSDINVIDSLNGISIAIDSEEECYYINPNKTIRNKMLTKQEIIVSNKDELQKYIGRDTLTKSGKRVNLYANMGDINNLAAILQNDAEGIGLMRSEFLYFGHNKFPTEEELFEVYKRIVLTMEGRPVVIRTLDISSDKKPDYFPLDQEENPVLGVRGVRISIEKEDIFKVQLKAIYRAAAFGEIRILLPMITSMWELDCIKKMIDEIIEGFKNEKVVIGSPKLGIMIETPAAAIISDEFAKCVDFMSVGTNDLTQYVLAADRGNEKISKYYNPKHLAMMRLLEMIANNAIRAGIPVGVCGESASDKDMYIKLINMGYNELSVSPNKILQIRKDIITSEKL